MTTTSTTMAQTNQMITRRSLLLQQVLYATLAYSLFALYGLGHISAVVMILGLSTFYLRLFDVLHQKSHANNSVTLKPQWLDWVADHINIYFLPYHEPPSGKVRKHMAHHQAHRRKDGSKFDSKKNPHIVFEAGGFIRTLAAALFYEEVMLYLDIKNHNLKRERLHSALIGVAVMACSILAFGFTKFFVFAMFYRVAFGLSWWGFSYIFHHDNVFGKQVDQAKHGQVVLIWQKIVGAGAVNSILFHEAHHLFPNVRGSELHAVAPSIVRSN